MKSLRDLHLQYEGIRIRLIENTMKRAGGTHLSYANKSDIEIANDERAKKAFVIMMKYFKNIIKIQDTTHNYSLDTRFSREEYMGLI